MVSENANAASCCYFRQHALRSLHALEFSVVGYWFGQFTDDTLNGSQYLDGHRSAWKAPLTAENTTSTSTFVYIAVCLNAARKV